MLLCLLQGLLTLAVVCLILYVLWWAVMKLLGVFEVAIPPKLPAIIHVIIVLVIVIIAVQAWASGDYCGPWSPRVR